LHHFENHLNPPERRSVLRIHDTKRTEPQAIQKLFRLQTFHRISGVQKGEPGLHFRFNQARGGRLIDLHLIN
jgi:hypothetical protein